MDPFSWREIIESVIGFSTIVISVVALTRTSKVAQNARLDKQHLITENSIEKLNQAFNNHLIKEVEDITSLKTNVINLDKNLNKIDAKVDRIIENLEKE